MAHLKSFADNASVFSTRFRFDTESAICPNDLSSDLAKLFGGGSTVKTSSGFSFHTFSNFTKGPARFDFDDLREVHAQRYSSQTISGAPKDLRDDLIVQQEVTTTTSTNFTRCNVPHDNPESQPQTETQQPPRESNTRSNKRYHYGSSQQYGQMHKRPRGRPRKHHDNKTHYKRKGEENALLKQQIAVLRSKVPPAELRAFDEQQQQQAASKESEIATLIMSLRSGIRSPESNPAPNPVLPAALPSTAHVFQARCPDPVLPRDGKNVEHILGEICSFMHSFKQQLSTLTEPKEKK